MYVISTKFVAKGVSSDVIFFTDNMRKVFGEKLFNESSERILLSQTVGHISIRQSEPALPALDKDNTRCQLFTCCMGQLWFKM